MTPPSLFAPVLEPARVGQQGALDRESHRPRPARTRGTGPQRRAGRAPDRGVRLADRTRTFTPPAPGGLAGPARLCRKPSFATHAGRLRPRVLEDRCRSSDCKLVGPRPRVRFCPGRPDRVSTVCLRALFDRLGRNLAHLVNTVQDLAVASSSTPRATSRLSRQRETRARRTALHWPRSRGCSARPTARSPARLGSLARRPRKHAAATAVAALTGAGLIDVAAPRGSGVRTPGLPGRGRLPARRWWLGCPGGRRHRACRAAWARARVPPLVPWAVVGRLDHARRRRRGGGRGWGLQGG